MPAPALNTGGNTFSGIEHLRNLLSAVKSACLCSWHLVCPYIVHDSSPPTNFISRSHCIKIQEYLVDGTISCLHTITKLSLSPPDIPWSDTRRATFPCPPPSHFSWCCLFWVSDHRIFRPFCPSIIGHSAHRHIPHAFGVVTSGFVLACVSFVDKLPLFSYVSLCCPFASSDMRMAYTLSVVTTPLPINVPVSYFR